MRFGSTLQDRAARVNYAAANWLPWFAWFPVQLYDGRWVWLERVERRCYAYYKVPVGVQGAVLYSAGEAYRLPGSTYHGGDWSPPDDAVPSYRGPFAE